MTEGAKKARRDYYKQYRERNADKLNDYKRKWNAANSDKVAESQRKYWERKVEQLSQPSELEQMQIEDAKRIDLLERENERLRRELEQCKIERMYLNEQLQKIKRAGKAVHDAVTALDIELNL